MSSIEGIEPTGSSSLPEPVVEGQCDDPAPLKNTSRPSTAPEESATTTPTNPLPPCPRAIRLKLRIDEQAIGPLYGEVVSFDKTTKVGHVRRVDTNTNVFVPQVRRMEVLLPVFVCTCKCTCMRACMSACMRACVHECVHACVHSSRKGIILVDA